jgi:probable rRNA maturation factor
MEAIINNFSGAKVDRSLIKKLARRVSKKKWKVSVSFVPVSAMKDLNRTYRKKNKPTDVLSFNMNEGGILGDVVICPSVARQNAKKYGVSLRSEVARLVTHGLLHLLGYDHGKKMFDLQEKILGGIYA